MVKKEKEEKKKKKASKEVIEEPEKVVQENKKKKFNLKGIWQWITGVWHWIIAKPIRWIAIAALLIVVIWVVNNQNQARKTAMDEYQTVKLERSDMVVIVGATGIVEANQTADLSWETTGRVEIVNVKANDRVKAGDILADLADNTLPQSVILAQADLVDAQKALEDLINSNTESA